LRKTLPDHLRPCLDLVLVGINPGLRSAAVGHHFAGHGNRFWRLLFESGLVPMKLDYQDDSRLPELGIGITNIVPRASRGVMELGPADYGKGRARLRAKILEYRPKAAGLVGITVFRELWPEISSNSLETRVACGRRAETIGETALFVLPNPSGRNAHFSYDEMLSVWRGLARFLGRSHA
jgi:TDG/mug DNA glycosylase family protein